MLEVIVVTVLAVPAVVLLSVLLAVVLGGVCDMVMQSRAYNAAWRRVGGYEEAELARVYDDEMQRRMSSPLGALVRLSLWFAAPGAVRTLGVACLLTLSVWLTPAPLRRRMLDGLSDIDGAPPGPARVSFALRALLAVLHDRLGGNGSLARSATPPRNEPPLPPGGHRVTIDRDGTIRVDYDDRP